MENENFNPMILNIALNFFTLKDCQTAFIQNTFVFGFSWKKERPSYKDLVKNYDKRREFLKSLPILTIRSGRGIIPAWNPIPGKFKKRIFVLLNNPCGIHSFL